jgi:predicted transglutaminase-like cysteine proteinase
MTATQTPRTETPSGKPPVRPPRGVVPVAAIIILAALTLILWMLSTSSRLETSPIKGTSAAASAPQAAPALRQASAGWNSGSVDAPAGHLMFCENSPALCGAPVPLAGYLQFCWNSPTLCTLPKPN